MTRPSEPLTLTPRACYVCGACAPLERHHLAPRHLFGDACERWPTVDVCRPCHEEWHRRVDGSIERYKRTAALMRQRRAAAIREGMEVRSTMPWAIEEREANERAKAERARRDTPAPAAMAPTKRGRS